MTKSKSTRYQPTSSTPPVDSDPLEIPLSEQIRLAESTGLFPPGTLKDPSTVRRRNPRHIAHGQDGVRTESLITRIDGPDGIGGARIDEIRLGSDTSGSESQGEDDQDDHIGLNQDQDQDQSPNPAPRLRTTKIPTGLKSTRTSDPSVTDTQLDLADETFIAIMYLIPMSSLYLLFDLLAHMSFNRDPGWMHYVKRLSTAIPTLAFMIFYTNRHASSPLMAILLMFASFGAGCRLFWLMNEANWTTVMRQAAPTVTLWILSVVQLPFGKLMISLVAVAGWYWYQGYELTLSLT